MTFNATWVCQVLRFHHCKFSAAFCWGFCPRLGWLAASCFRLGLHSELFTSQCLGSNKASTVILKANGRSPRGTNQEGCKCFLANKIGEHAKNCISHSDHAALHSSILQNYHVLQTGWDRMPVVDPRADLDCTLPVFSITILLGPWDNDTKKHSSRAPLVLGQKEALWRNPWLWPSAVSRRFLSFVKIVVVSMSTEESKVRIYRNACTAMWLMMASACDSACGNATVQYGKYWQ